uniref:Uncharacterized protein n=1 Tax=Anguilla anguilla TaxID=7936 RepID=A0A0E9PWG1_ANGAN
MIRFIKHGTQLLFTPLSNVYKCKRLNFVTDITERKIWKLQKMHTYLIKFVTISVGVKCKHIFSLIKNF